MCETVRRLSLFFCGDFERNLTQKRGIFCTGERHERDGSSALRNRRAFRRETESVLVRREVGPRPTLKRLCLSQKRRGFLPSGQARPRSRPGGSAPSSRPGRGSPNPQPTGTRFAFRKTLFVTQSFPASDSDLGQFQKTRAGHVAFHHTFRSSKASTPVSANLENQRKCKSQPVVGRRGSHRRRAPSGEPNGGVDFSSVRFFPIKEYHVVFFARTNKQKDNVEGPTTVSIVAFRSLQRNSEYGLKYPIRDASTVPTHSRARVSCRLSRTLSIAPLCPVHSVSTRSQTPNAEFSIDAD